MIQRSFGLKDAAENGSSKEMSFVLIGEPGNGKTFFVDYLSRLYRNFISISENNRFTFQFKNLDQLKKQIMNDLLVAKKIKWVRTK